jgi:hypothetical protein
MVERTKEQALVRAAATNVEGRVNVRWTTPTIVVLVSFPFYFLPSSSTSPF